jgi:hypothetical protein
LKLKKAGEFLLHDWKIKPVIQEERGKYVPTIS